MLVALTLCVGAMAAEPLKVVVANPLNYPRAEEMVEIELTEIQKKLGDVSEFLVTDADGNEIPSQVTYDKKLIFQPGVPAKGKATYFIKVGKPKMYEPRVHGRQFPERVDDMAWENDRVAFRCYGPALQASGERAWGYDIWNKRTDKLVIEDRFAGELDPEIASVCKKLRDRGEYELADDVYNAVSYHVDHGNGMDCYKVGPTLGAGTTAPLENGGKDIHYPRCYKSFQLLDQGPIRFTVKLVYGTENIDGAQVDETRIISLDAGCQMNKAIISYNGLKKDAPIATGIIVHNENPTAYILNQKDGYMGYEDLGDPNQYKEKYRAKQNQDFGKIYVGAVYEKSPASMEFRGGEGLPGAIGHILGITNYQGGEYVYYFGTGWSRNTNTKFLSLTDWEAYLSKFAEQIHNPLKVKL